MEKKCFVATMLLVVAYAAQLPACAMGMYDVFRKPVSTWECVYHIKNVLNGGGDVKERLSEYGIGYPLHVAASAAETHLIEPLVHHGFSLIDKNADGFSPLELVIGGSVMIGKQVEVVEEMFRVVPSRDYETLLQQLYQKTGPETFNGPQLSQMLKHVSDKNWRTRTWQLQVKSFLMASHVRAGSVSTVRALNECPGLFVEIANWLPRYEPKKALLCAQKPCSDTVSE